MSDLAAAAAHDSDNISSEPPPHNNNEDEKPLVASSPQAEGKNTTKRSKRRRQGLLLFSGAYTLLYVGAFFGWGPMQLMLEANGSFAQKCTAAEQAAGTVCPEQTAALINIHFIASTTQVVAPCLGQLVDHYGAPTVAVIMSICIVVGLSLLVVATEFVTDPLLYVALIVLSLGTWFGGMLTIQTGMYFSGKSRHRVIVALNSLFDSGAITYLGLWAIQEATGASVSSVLLGYLGLGVLLLGGGCYCWKVVEPDPACEAAETEHAALSVAGAEERLDDKNVTGDRGVVPVKEPDADEVNAGADNNDGQITTSNDAEIKASTDLEALEIETACSTESPNYVLIRDRTAFQQLTSMPALMLGFYFTIHVTSNQWTMTTTRDFLAYLGDDEYNNRYLTIFTLLMPASLVFIPCVDLVLNRYGFAGGFQFVNVLAFSYNLIRVFSDNLNVQILGFILFSCFRCFLFGIASSFLPTILSANMNGKAAGLLYAVTGLVGFANIPVARVTVVQLEGNFFVPNLIWTILVFPCIGAAW